MENDGIDLKTAAEFLGCKMTKIRELEKLPDFPSYTIGRKILVSRSRLIEWQQKQIDLYKDEKSNNVFSGKEGVR